MIPFSILDLSPITEGAAATDAFRNTRDLAQHAEQWGYHRYWLAEHHNMPGIASAATAIVIAYVAAGTQSIRVGSGGIMLPNHSPLVIAEQFGTLASLFGGRIDLGLGRAPGTDTVTMRALRRDPATAADSFPRDVQELLYYFQPAEPGQKVRAIPGVGLKVPIWLLGSSLFSAQLAALLGLPFAFASHFAPTDLIEALHVYRELFKPSKQLRQPYAMVAANVITAPTDAEARFLFTSLQQSFLNLRRGMPGQLPPPVENIDAYFGSPAERSMLEQTLYYSFVGSPETIAGGLQSFLDSTRADELIITGHIYDHNARLRSFELVSQLHHLITASRHSAPVSAAAVRNS
jgi:luciferase family oxidoreductase group 1